MLSFLHRRFAFIVLCALSFALFSLRSSAQTFRITAQYLGTIQTTHTPPDQAVSTIQYLAAPIYIPPNYTFELSSLQLNDPNDPPPIGQKHLQLKLGNYGGTSHGHSISQMSTSGAKVRFTVFWDGSTGDDSGTVEPFPFEGSTQIPVTFTYSIAGHITAGPPDNSVSSGYATVTADLSLGEATISDSVFAPGSLSQYDKALFSGVYRRAQTLTLQRSDAFHASGTIDLDLSADIHFDQTEPGTVSSAVVLGSFNATYDIDVKIGNQSPARFDQSALTGANPQASSDPTFTRWLPLSFSPHFISQPYGEEGDYLAAPWGNLRCFYSPTIVQVRNDTDALKNSDLNQGTVFYIPTPTEPKPYTVIGNGNGFQTKYVLTDAAGTRLLFDANKQGFNDVHGTLRQTVDNDLDTVWILSNAGPPEAMKEAGTYTYTFRQVSLPGSPVRCVLKSIEDDNGNKQSLSFNGGLTVTDVTSGRQLIFAANASGYYNTVTAPGGNQTLLTFDGTGHLKQLRVTDGVTILSQEDYAYGTAPLQDNILQTTRNGVTTTFGYQIDPHLSSYTTPRLVSESVSGGATWTITHGAMTSDWSNWGKASRTQTISNSVYPNDPVTMEYLLDKGFFGDVVGMNVHGPTFAGAGSSNDSSVRYAPSMRAPTSITLRTPIEADPTTTNAWQTTLNTQGNPLTITNPLNQSVTVEYDASGIRPIKVTDPTGIKAQFEYTPQANLLWKVYDNQSVLRTQFGYNPNGQLTTATIPAAANVINADAVTTFAYNGTTGDLTSVTNPLGDILSVDAYDAFGDPLSVTVYPTTGNPLTGTADRLTASRVLDAAQRVTDKYAPNGVHTVNTWGSYTPTTPPTPNVELGRLTDIKTYAPAFAGGALLSSMHIDHDALGRLQKATDWVGQCARYEYDLLSRLTGIRDGRDNLTGFDYGKNGEPIKVTWNSGFHADLTYDSGGRVQFSTDERGRKVEYRYDGAWRLKEMRLYAVDGVSLVESVLLTYDDAGRVRTVTDNSGSRTYTYEPDRKRLQTVTTVLAALPAGSNTFTLTYGYYPDGSVASVTSALAGQWSAGWSYSYDKAGQLLSLTNPQNIVTAYTYDHIGRLTSQTSGGNVVSASFTYGNSGQTGDNSRPSAYLQRLDYSLNGTPRYTVPLVHSYLGQLKQQTINELNSGTLLQGQYTYDQRGRVTTENVALTPDPGNGGTSEDIGGLGEVGHVGLTYLVSDTYAYDLSNNVRPVQSSGISNPPPPAWMFNADNQLTGSAFSSWGLDGESSIGYDASGNVNNLNGQTLTWDGWGRLTGVGSNITYAYDSAGRRIRKTVGGVSTYYLYAGSTLIAELNAQGQLQRSYTWGVNGLVSDYSAGDGTRYYLFDGQGSTFGMAGGNGTLLGVAGFGAWGKTLASTLPNTPFGWKGQAGQFTDTETGNLYLHRRYYSPKLGRFLSRDPIGFAGGINLYAYCGGDPVNFLDPSGLEAMPQLPWSPPPAPMEPVVTSTAPVGLTAGRAGVIGLGLYAGYDLYTYQPGVRTGLLTGIPDALAGKFWEWVYSGAAEAAAQPVTIAQNPRVVPEIEKKDDKPHEEEYKVHLFRGVGSGHRHYVAALLGIAIPLGGDRTPFEHNWGYTDSKYTSWTIFYGIAAKHAKEYTGDGVVLEKDFRPDQLISSPDEFDEYEFLIEGVVIGAKVIKP